jgi:hypothetical protein
LPAFTIWKGYLKNAQYAVLGKTSTMEAQQGLHWVTTPGSKKIVKCDY